MARKPIPTTPPTEGPQILPAVAADVVIDQTEMALAEQAQNASARAMAAKLGYQLPVDSTSPDLIQRDIAVNMRRSAESCLEIGKGLAVLKEACGHGDFLQRLDCLNIETRVAQRFMLAAHKFSNAATSPHLVKAIGSQSKLLEMLVLDDEQIEELELTGQTGELALDDVARMSVKELRAALREAKEEREASDKVLADKNARIDKLAREVVKAKKRIEDAAPDEVLAELKREASNLAHDASGLVRGNLRLACKALYEWADANDGHAATGALLAGLLGQVEQNIKDLREEFNVPDVGPNPLTAWVNEV